MRNVRVSNVCVCADMFHRTVAAAEGEFVESGLQKLPESCSSLLNMTDIRVHVC